MMQQTHDEQTPSATSGSLLESTPAALVRVTSDELATALSALENRKDAEERNTIAIGDAIRQLGIDAAPEEVLAEVMAQRRRTVAAQRETIVAAQRAKAATSSRRSGVAVVIGGILFLLFILLFFGRAQVASHAPEMMPAQISVPYVQPASPPTVQETLQEVGNGESFYCGVDEAGRIMQGKASSSVVVTHGTPANYLLSSSTWTFTKRDGHLYAQGFVPVMSPEVMAAGPITICTSRLDATGAGGLNYSEPIALRIGAFRLHRIYTGDPSTMKVSDVHLDKWGTI